MKLLIKRIIVYVLVLTCVLGISAPLNLKAAQTKYSGISGKIKWTIDDAGTLTLKGKGEAYRNYSYNGEYIYEWISHRDDIKKVVVNVSGMKDATLLFKNLNNVKSMDLSKFDTSKVTDMTGMFTGCENLTKLNLSNFNTRNVTVMKELFLNCKSLKSLDLSSFDTSNVTNMAYMFSGCESLTKINMSNFDTSNVTSMMCMFSDCQSLPSLDLNDFDTKQLAGIEGMFNNCSKLSTTLTLVKLPATDRGIFVDAALQKGTKITLNYGGEYTLDMARDLIDSRTDGSHVSLGKKIKLKSQTVKAKVSSKNLKYSKLKKNSQSFSIGATAKTSVNYKVLSGKKYVSVKSNGKVTVKKGTPKGNYRIIATAQKSSKYKRAIKHIYITVK